jgi:hypothetical protein
VNLQLDQGLEDAVARCLAKQDGNHIGANDWASNVGDRYREKASDVLRTVDNYQAGIRSGGLLV